MVGTWYILVLNKNDLQRYRKKNIEREREQENVQKHLRVGFGNIKRRIEMGGKSLSFSYFATVSIIVLCHYIHIELSEFDSSPHSIIHLLLL